MAEPAPGGDTPHWRKHRREGDDKEAVVSLSALECGVCLSLVCQPVSLSCGHTFCRVCLINTLRRNKKKCPTCRAVCHNSAEDQPEDVMIANIARSCFPELSERRRREVEADRDTWITVLPVFYYNMPMFPGETLNLHLFEPRYKLMIQRIVNTSRRFAYVPNYTDYTARVGDVAMIAEIRECEFLADGRVLLDAKLVSRQTVADHFVEEGTQGLHFCRVEARTDDPPVDANAAAELEELHERTRSLAEHVVGPVRAQIVDRFGEMPAGAEYLSLWISSVLPMPVRDKHELLAGRSTMARLQACEHHLASLSGNSPPTPPSRVPAAAVAEAYEAFEAARRLGVEEAAAASAAAAVAAVRGAGVGGGSGAGTGIGGAAGSGESSGDNGAERVGEGGDGNSQEGKMDVDDDDDGIMAVALGGPEHSAGDLQAADMIAAHTRAMAAARAELDMQRAAAAASGSAVGAGEGQHSGQRGERRREEEKASESMAPAGARSRENGEETDQPRATSMGVDQPLAAGLSSDAGLLSLVGGGPSNSPPSPQSMAARGNGGGPAVSGEMERREGGCGPGPP